MHLVCPLARPKKAASDRHQSNNEDNDSYHSPIPPPRILCVEPWYVCPERTRLFKPIYFNLRYAWGGIGSSTTFFIGGYPDNPI
jgi:hypothetical protein